MSGDFNILLVEDNDIDAAILKRGLKNLGAEGHLVRAQDGLEALELLREDLKDRILPRPYVILLDINMPRMDGLEFLTELRADPSLRGARVVVFTTSDSRKDVERAYQECANGYIVKPDSASELQAILSTLSSFWKLCEHPEDHPA